MIFQTNPEQHKLLLQQELPALQLNIDSLKHHFNHFLATQIHDNGEAYALAVVCVFIVIMIFFKNVFRYLATYFLAQVRVGYIEQLRNKIYRKSVLLPISFHTEERKGNILSKMSNDVQQIEWSIVISIEALFKDPITIIFYFVSMVIMSPQLTLFVIIFFPIVGFIISKIGRSLKKSAKQSQDKMGGIMSIIEETLSGIRIIKAFNTEEHFFNKFGKQNALYTRISRRLFRKRDLASPVTETLSITALAVVLWFGGQLVFSGKIGDPGVFIGYVALFSQLISPAKSLTNSIFNMQRGAASLDRIDEMLDEEEVIQNKQNAVNKKTFEDKITYENLSFKYVNDMVLKNINIEIKKGQTIALVGQSGSGKSTLADLLPRFYDPVDGDLLIDGVPLRDMNLKDLRALMGIVTQQSILFNENVFNNIAFGLKNVKEAEVHEAAKVANAHEFITELERGYYTNIGDGGNKLSGGQKQRISIARAILKNPPILILDEATSALDTESERLVQDALQNLMKNRTSLVIAHRLSTIQHADEILVMDKGQIVERGKHDELIQQNGIYKKLCDLQSFG